jgi:uncharacterized spore protein YtfJ
MEEQSVEVVVQKSLSVMDNTLDKFLAASSVDAVYGEPIRHADTLIIPTAEVLSGLGFGAADGSGGPADEKTGARPWGGGGGGGGRILTRPVAVVVVSPEGGVRVQPVVDKTKIWLAGLTAFGFAFTMLVRMLGKTEK